MTSKLQHIAAVSALLLLLGGLFGCGEQTPSRDVVVGQGSKVFPDDSLRDWKSYADHLAVFQVLGERELPMDPESAAQGEGLVPRAVDVRFEAPLWSAPNAPALPDEASIVASGWVLSEGQRHEFRIEGSPRVEVGETFLAPLFRREEPRRWGAMAAELRLENGRIAPDAHADIPTPFRESLIGKTPQEVADALRDAPSNPIAEKYRDLRPVDRVRAVIREQRER